MKELKKSPVKWTRVMAKITRVLTFDASVARCIVGCERSMGKPPADSSFRYRLILGTGFHNQCNESRVLFSTFMFFMLLVVD